jgi:hypothetical protein
MIRHIVLVRFPVGTGGEVKAALWRDLDALRDRIPGMTGFEVGPNVSPEGLARGYTDGFVVTFADAAARDAYLVHPDHQAIGGRIVAAAEGGLEGVLVFDFEA